MSPILAFQQTMNTFNLYMYILCQHFQITNHNMLRLHVNAYGRTSLSGGWCCDTWVRWLPSERPVFDTTKPDSLREDAETFFRHIWGNKSANFYQTSGYFEAVFGATKQGI